MTQPLDNSTASFPATINVASDGDDATMDAPTDPLKAGLDALSNRDQYLIDNLNGLLLHKPYARSSADGESPLTIGPIAKVFLRNASIVDGSQVRAAARNTEQPLAFAGLTAGLWYYVYAYLSGGTLAFELDDDPPSQSTGYQFKTGDPTRRYLFPVRAISPTAVQPFSLAQGRYVWRYSGRATFEPRYLYGGTATGWTTQSLTKGMPPHARECLLRLYAENRKTLTTTSLQVRTKGDTANQHDVTADISSGTTAQRAWNTTPILTDASQEIEYRVLNTGLAADADTALEVLEFWEP